MSFSSLLRAPAVAVFGLFLVSSAAASCVQSPNGAGVCPEGYALTVLNGGCCQVFQCCTTSFTGSCTPATGVANNATQCGALGDFYYSTSSWGNGQTLPWGTAASGSHPTDFHTFPNGGSGGAIGSDFVRFDIASFHLMPGTTPNSIPDTIGALTALQYFGGAYTACDGPLSGTLPSAFGSLHALTTIDLSSFGLSGTLPASLGSLTNLRALQLNGNSFTGSIPASIGSLPLLTTFSQNGNSFTGALPSSVINFCVRTLGCDFSGGSNAVTASIVDYLSSLPLNITSLALIPTDNNIPPPVRGAIWTTNTDLSALSSFSSLTSLSLAGFGSSLAGSFPAVITNLTNLVHLDLKGNAFNSSLPAALTQLTGLTYLDLHNNYFYGALPDGVATFTATMSLNSFMGYTVQLNPQSTGALTLPPGSGSSSSDVAAQLSALQTAFAALQVSVNQTAAACTAAAA